MNTNEKIARKYAIKYSKGVRKGIRGQNLTMELEAQKRAENSVYSYILLALNELGERQSGSGDI